MGKAAKLSKAGGAYAKKASVNKAFRTKHKISYSGPQNKTKKKANLQLREVDIPAFEIIVGLKQQSARNLLIKHGVLPDIKTWKRNPKPMYCWLCSQPMEWKDGVSLRCTAGRACSRPLLKTPDYVFTPFFRQQQSGKKDTIDFVSFVRSAWALGCKIQNDAALHLVKKPDARIETARDRVFHEYRLHKIALAFSELDHAEKIQYPIDILEVDTARHGSRKDAATGDRIHTGRQLVFKTRKTKEWSTHSLGTSKSSGSRGSKPETKAEVTPLVTRKMPRGGLLAADGARAWKGAARSADKAPLLPGVCHQKKVFTPTSRVLKKDVGSKARRFLKRQSETKKPLVREYQKHWVLAGGDQACESQFAHIQSTSKRVQGSGKRMHDITRSLQSQSAAALLRHPGFYRVLDSHRLYRQKLMTGTLRLAPTDAYQLHRVTWLLPDMADT